MRKKRIIIIMSVFITLIITTIVFADININKTKQEQYKKDFDSFTLKTDFKNRDEVGAESIRLGTAYKHAIRSHGNDEYSKEATNKFETMSQQLENIAKTFPVPSLDLNKEIEDQYKFFNDDLARQDSSGESNNYKNSKYALDEAQGIYDQYKKKTITTQQAYDRIMNIKFTDRQNGIKN